MAQNRQQQFKYQVAEITSDRTGDYAIDVRSLIVELVFFEALDKPYISGQIAVSDDAGLFDNLVFSGTERLHIKMLTELDNTSAEKPVMDRSFILTGIDNIVKSSNSGNSSIYVFSFMDEHAFVSKSKNVSRAVRDNLSIEILKLCQNELGKDVDLSYASQSVQNNFKGIIPYMHPLEAAVWLTNKATTELGMPFFLYASIHDTNLRFGSLDVMLQQSAWNKEVPFIFSPANTQKQEESNDPTLQYFQVQTMRSSKLQNTLKLVQSGSIGSLYAVTDLGTGQTTAQHFSVKELLSTANANGLINTTRQNVYDDLYKTPVFDEINIGGDYLHNTNSQIFHNVVSRGVYGNKKSLHDETTSAMFLKKIENMAYRNLIFKNMIDVTVPGPGFIASGGSVGDKIRINVLNDNNNPESPDQLDGLRSGDFLVYNTRHTFRDTRHDVAMTVFKLERGPNVD
jgi:hypothetical protein